MSVQIYALRDPFWDMAGVPSVRYIGKTNNMQKRLLTHRSGVDGNPHKHNWLKKLESLGAEPIVEILETATLENWKEREIALIREYRSFGEADLNMLDGGDVTPPPPSKLPAYWCEAIAASKRGKKYSDKHKEAMRGYATNRSDMHRQKLSEAARRRWSDPAKREYMSQMAKRRGPAAKKASARAVRAAYAMKKSGAWFSRFD